MTARPYNEGMMRNVKLLIESRPIRLNSMHSADVTSTGTLRKSEQMLARHNLMAVPSNSTAPSSFNDSSCHSGVSSSRPALEKVPPAPLEPSEKGETQIKIKPNRQDVMKPYLKYAGCKKVKQTV